MNNQSATPMQAELITNIRRLWINHIVWIRSYIISFVVHFSNIPFIRQRILQNFQNFADSLMMFYDFSVSKTIESLFQENFYMFEKYLDSLKSGDTEAIDAARTEWYKSGEDIADYLSDINRHAIREHWHYLVQDHLRIIENEVLLRMAEHYGAENDRFDRVEDITLEIADYMAKSIIQQFNL